jgi:hypothetical protein
MRTTVLMVCLGLTLAWSAAQADSLNCRLVGSCDTPGSAGGVAVSGNYAYVADGPTGLRVIDVTNPQNPIEVGYCALPTGMATYPVVSGNYAYVANDVAGLRIIDVASPQNPTEVGHYDTPGQASGVAVFGSYAYVADRYSGLRVIDITSSTNPTEVGYFVTPDAANCVVVSGNYAYVAGGVSGLRVINVTNPQSPAEVGYYDNKPGFTRGVALSGNYAYVANDDSGLLVCQYTGAGVAETPPAGVLVPNAGSTIVRGVLFLPESRGEKREARCELLDVSGRGVLNLKPGANDVSRLSPGVYFATEQSAFSSQHSGPTGVTKVIVTR